MLRKFEVGLNCFKAHVFVASNAKLGCSFSGNWSDANNQSQELKAAIVNPLCNGGLERPQSEFVVSNALAQSPPKFEAMADRYQTIEQYP